jgi:hypothetical protein
MRLRAVSVTDNKRLAIWGGLLAGLGLGACLAWALNIFEVANPQSTYPSMTVTVLFVLVASGASGVGLGLVASSLIRGESGTSSSPSGQRSWLGFSRDAR